MRKIVDSNYLNNPGLITYLSASRQNFAVLCDYAAMEAYKSKCPLEGICESMAVLARFPKQVLILRTTTEIRMLKPAHKGIQDRLINKAGTKNFSKFCAQIDLARSERSPATEAILAHGRSASAFADDSMNDSDSLRNAIIDLGREFSAAELSALRDESPWPNSLTKKFGDYFIDILACYYDDGDIAVPSVTLGELRFTFNFRYVLCCYILILRWIAKGCPPSNPSKIRNHMFDSAFAAYATFFDGFLSNDMEALTTYRRAREFLSV